jgi:hypothetical protein
MVQQPVSQVLEVRFKLVGDHPADTMSDCVIESIQEVIMDGEKSMPI